MAKDTTVYANAQPEKRLFIHLITRDISLVAAVLDLLDNSINSAAEARQLDLSNPTSFMGLLSGEKPDKLPLIAIEFDSSTFKMSDECGGIRLQDAQERVFAFGRPTEQAEGHTDTLSVYGIGMKRALFKLGNVVEIDSANRSGGFDMALNVDAWQKKKQAKWQFPISARSTKLAKGIYGTEIRVKDLYPDIRNRLTDERFEGDLIDRISETYSYFLDRIVRVEVNGTHVEGFPLEIGSNQAEESFVIDDVGCTVLAGISRLKGQFYRAEDAGWYIYCNGRAVAVADKSELTGWGVFLPAFQPKHRPFLGVVFFASAHLESLPWTTTKASINEESAVWQAALRRMASVAKPVVNALDRRYTNEGTEVSTKELDEFAGRPVSALSSITGTARAFAAPKPRRTTTSIQYNVKITERDQVREYLGDRSMSNSEIGRFTFEHYLTNVVGDE